MESRGCDTFSSRPAGTFDSNAGSVSVNMACLCEWSITQYHASTKFENSELIR